MKLFYSKYFLKGKAKNRSQAGALLKIQMDEFWGVADICPKPKLGDATLENELSQRGPLLTRALELAGEDLQARKSGLSLLMDKPVRNNILVTDYDVPNDVKGKTVKIKADKNFDRLLNVLEQVEKARLDFNSLLTPGEFEQLLTLLPEHLKNKIEYIEDPTLFMPQWQQWNRIVPLAFDLQNQAEYSVEFASYRIIKPCRQPVPGDLKNVTFTSAMDHPVGVAHGLRIAQSLTTGDSGFLTLDLYEDIGFNKYFIQEGCFLNFSESALNDTGIGMTDELDKLEWTHF